MSAYQVQTDPTNVLPKRYGAAVLDFVLESVVWIIAFVLGFALFSHDVIRYDYDRYGGNYGPYKSTELTGAGWIFVLVVGFAYMISVFVIQRGLSGKTPGTMALGLVVVDDQGKPIGPARALWRSVAGIVDYIGICSIPIVGIATSASSKGHRRVGDMAAKSFVVDRSGFGQPVVVPSLNPPGAGPYAAPYGQAYGAPGQPYGAQPYGAPGATPYPPQPSYPGQPQYPAQAPYPAQPSYGAPAPAPAPAPSEPGTGWPTPTATPAPAPDDGSGWGAPGATDAPAPAPTAEPAPAQAVETPPVETPPATPAATPPAAAPETVEPTPSPEPTPAPAPEAAADPTQPQWDPARNAYIQWDPAGQRWMQFDDATQQWRPIS